MSGGCQVDVRWITSPLPYLSHLSYWSYSPHSANLANQPTFFQTIYTRVCAYVYILYKKVGWQVGYWACV